MQGIAFGNQVGLKGFGVIAQYAPRLGQVNFKTCAFGHAVFPGPAQTDHRVHNVFSGAGATLVAGFSGMMDKQDGHPSAA